MNPEKPFYAGTCHKTGTILLCGIFARIARRQRFKPALAAEFERRFPGAAARPGDAPSFA